MISMRVPIVRVARIRRRASRWTTRMASPDTEAAPHSSSTQDRGAESSIIVATKVAATDPTAALWRTSLNSSKVLVRRRSSYRPSSAESDSQVTRVTATQTSNASKGPLSPPGRLRCMASAASRAANTATASAASRVPKAIRRAAAPVNRGGRVCAAGMMSGRWATPGVVRHC